MGHRPARVPQFGNWGANDDVPFTAVFNNARTGKGEGKIVNPNDPAENPAAFGLKPSHDSGPNDFDNTHFALEGGFGAQQGGDGYGNSKTSRVDPMKKTPAISAKENSSGADGSRKGNNAGPDDSPNHQMYEGRLGNKPGSPFRNVPDSGNTHPSSTPGKSRLRGSSHVDEMPDRSAALPKFGAWKEDDPSAGEGFTRIFNEHRNEKKQGGPIRVPSLKGEHNSKPNYDGQVKGSQQQKRSSFWSCCLGSSTSD